MRKIAQLVRSLLAISQKLIANAAGVSPSTVARIVNQDPRARIAHGTRERVLRIAHALDYDFSRCRRRHQRSAERVAVDLPVNVEVLLRDGLSYDRGTARLVEFSAAGALLTGLELQRGSLPVVPFVVRLEFFDEILLGIVIHCEVVRLEHKDELRLGARFMSLASKSAQRIEQYVKRVVTSKR